MKKIAIIMFLSFFWMNNNAMNTNIKNNIASNIQKIIELQKEAIQKNKEVQAIENQITTLKKEMGRALAQAKDQGKMKNIINQYQPKIKKLRTQLNKKILELKPEIKTKQKEIAQSHKKLEEHLLKLQKPKNNKK